MPDRKLTFTLGAKIADAMNDEMKYWELPCLFEAEMMVTDYLRAVGVWLVIHNGRVTIEQANELQRELAVPVSLREEAA